ncbi:hypothetical protein MTR_7g071330 [Medicago truncatula]|uniref:Uncharacterized protein n=1 Tax=Medicago truncatula TaxID=3880 RepID=G7KV29_MEDTR|nr:hypothetical protein MTR_7g071330 [Medicago truncatula]
MQLATASNLTRHSKLGQRALRTKHVEKTRVGLWGQSTILKFLWDSICAPCPLGNIVPSASEGISKPSLHVENQGEDVNQGHKKGREEGHTQQLP